MIDATCVDEYKRLCSSYHKNLKRLIYGLKFIKCRSVKDTATLKSYSEVIDSVHASYMEYCKFCANYSIPVKFELNYKGPGFILHEGFLYGNIESARSFSSRVLSQFNNTADGLKTFAIGEYLSACVDKEKSMFIEIPSAIKELYPDNQSKVSNDNIIAKERNLGDSLISMFMTI